MNIIHLHGHLGAVFGSEHRMTVSTIREAIRALCTQLKGFRQKLREGTYRVVIGNLDRGFELTAADLALRIGTHDVHFLPAPVGAGNGGTGKIILGTVLVAAAIITYNPELIGVDGGLFGASAATSTAVAFGLGVTGISLILAGVSNLLSPSPQAPRDSYLFGNTANTTNQGGPVPLVYGRTQVGSVVISASLDNSQVGTNSSQAVPVPNDDFINVGDD